MANLLADVSTDFFATVEDAEVEDLIAFFLAGEGLTFFDAGFVTFFLTAIILDLDYFPFNASH